MGPPPYFEEQRQHLCGLHALNHAVGFAAFTEADMEAAVGIILDEACAAARAAGVPREERRENHILPGGGYSEQVLAGALLASGAWVFDQAPLKLQARGYETLWDLDVVGALAHIPGHWLALRCEKEVVWLLGSLHAQPVHVGRKGSATVGAMLASFACVFLIRTQGVVRSTGAAAVEACAEAPAMEGAAGPRRSAAVASSPVCGDVFGTLRQEDEAGTREMPEIGDAGRGKHLADRDQVGSDVQELLRRFECYLRAPAELKAASVRQIKARQIGKLVNVKGVVIRATEVKPLQQSTEERGCQ